ncbi:MAG: SpoIIE family protein phosphatase [Planctomycetaceae bacterium]|nr:SpoIIE family protein phosphatase [Planctomycetaceae bacterium]
MRVLVGWDVQEEADLLELYLNVDGDEVVIKTDWDEFLEAANAVPPWDVYLINTSSPDTDSAFKAFQKLKEISADHPVVGAALQSDVYRIAKFLTAGLRSYIIRDENKDYMFLLHAALSSAIEAVRAERERMISAKLRQEIDSVRKLQESIIPRLVDMPAGYDIKGRYESSEISVYGGQPVTMAGGDYYNALVMPDGNIALIVGDASGHGMKACVSIMTLHTLIQMFPSKGYRKTSAFVKQINENLSKQTIVNDDGGFITLLYGVLNPKKHTFEWSSAGHPLPILQNFADGSIGEKGDNDLIGMPLGIWEEAEYTSQKITLPPSSRLLLYTDGLAEAFNDEGKEGQKHVEFGTKGIIDILKETANDSPASTVDSLFSASHAFTKGVGRHDDTSMLIVHRE